MSYEFRTRDSHSFWNNQGTITDVHEALSLLRTDSFSNEPTHLRRSLIEIRYMWEIVVPWYREGSSGADTSGEDYYDVSDEVAKSLQDERFVEPYIKKGWGWSYPDPERLIITLSGTEALHTYETDLYATACTLLRPGIHTDLSGTPARRSSGRDHWRSGRYFVDFDTPRGDVCRVYPEQCELVFPFEPEKQPVAA